MEYCILIELSRTRVTFSAYTGGEGGFVPYGDAHRPLAVWFSGSSVIVGKDAKQQALSGTPNAFTDLFERMKELGHFDYANETHDYNKLVLYTLRAGMKEFFTNQLLNSQGALEDNVAHLPLVMMFGADLDEYAPVVLSQLRDNGFGNVMRADEDDYILRSLPPSRQADAKLVLSSDGETLFGDVYVGTKCESSFALSKAGRDPRVDKLSELVWERTQAENDWLVYDKELPELQRASNRFILSGEASFDGSVTLSNGVSYHYYLSKGDLQLFNRQHNTEVLPQIFSQVSTQVDRHKCTVVLKGLAATNKYLQELLAPEFAALVLVEKDLQEANRLLLLQDCRKRQFKFGTTTPSSPPTGVKGEPLPPQAGSTAGTPLSPTSASVVPSKRDERDFKALQMSIETCRNNNDGRRAKAEANAFLQQMHEKGVTAFDEKVEALLNGFAEPAEKPKSVSTSVEPSGIDKREMKMLRATIRTYLENGNSSKIKSEVQTFRRKMHAKNVHAFDEELDSLEKQTAAAPKAVSRPSGTTATKSAGASKSRTEPGSGNDGKELMRKGKLKEARDWFRANNWRAEADDCTALIKWQKFVPLYKGELKSTADAHNRDKARARAKEIEDYVAMYKKYGMDFAGLAKLAADYKRIR